MSTGTRRPTITWVLLPDSNISNLKPKPNRIFQWKCQRIFFILSTFSKSIIIRRWPNHRSPSSFCPGFELHIFPYFYVSTFTGALPWSSSYGGSLLGGRKVKLGGNEICLQTGVRSLRENGGRGVPTIEGSFKKNLFEWEQKFYLKTRKSWKWLYKNTKFWSSNHLLFFFLDRISILLISTITRLIHFVFLCISAIIIQKSVWFLTIQQNISVNINTCFVFE